MNYTYFIGIDNGVTGSVGIITPNDKTAFIPTPVIKCESYTKEKQYIQRVDWRQLIAELIGYPIGNTIVLIERPMVNPRAFKATQSALRALEATLICIESNLLDFAYIDSKEWQREFISSAVIGHDEMKKASMEIGIEMFPNHASAIRKHGDADGLLIAAYAKKKYSK